MMFSVSVAQVLQQLPGVISSLDAHMENGLQKLEPSPFSNLLIINVLYIFWTKGAFELL